MRQHSDYEFTRPDALITDESRSHDTKQLCEIHCEVTEFSEEHKLFSDETAMTKQKTHGAQCSQKTFQSTIRNHLLWIYCSNNNYTMVLCQKCGIFKCIELYYIINVDEH